MYMRALSRRVTEWLIHIHNFCVDIVSIQRSPRVENKDSKLPSVCTGSKKNSVATVYAENKDSKPPSI